MRYALLTAVAVAAADFFVMPSRFEPCGLAQQYAMRYGALPVARRTGGLADTIRDFEKAPRVANGFLFGEMKGASLAAALTKASKIHAKPKTIARMRYNAMLQKASWDEPADRYIEIYRWALESRRGKLTQLSGNPRG